MASDREHAEEIAKILANRGFHAAAAGVRGFADRIEALGRENGRLRAIVRVNLLRHVPGASHASIDELLGADTALSGTPAPDALVDIASERRRQIESEGWSSAHDDEHLQSALAQAAACYAICDFPHQAAQEATERLWPWERKWWKPKDRRRNLVRSGALIVAEIERLDRLTARSGESGNG